MKELTINELFDLSRTLAKDLLLKFTYPWEALPKIKEYILTLGKTLFEDEYDHPADGVWIAKSAVISPSASVNSPCIIGKNVEIRQCAFIRGAVIIGNGAVVGNSCELKNSILFDEVQVPHFNYVGDSILGFRAHLGAGAITSNVKSDKSLITVSAGGKIFKTGLNKMGAILGDRVEIGCNSVLNPGTVIGKDCIVYPLSSVRGFIPPKRIFKAPNRIVTKET